MKDWKETEIGKIPINWNYQTISETNILIGDGNYSSKYPKQNELLDDGIPFISSNDLKNGRISSQNLRYISIEHHSRLLKGHIRKDDVLMVVRGNGVGDVAIVDACFEDANINAQIAFFRQNKNVDGKFLHYQFLNYKNSGEIEKYVSGSAQPQITVGSLNQVKILLPPLPEQRAIAAILSSLDDKIDLLYRQNKTLEAMAETLFRQWFVNNDELRMQNEEWKIGQVSDLIEFNPTRSLPKGTVAPYLEMANVSTNVFHPENWYDREFSSGMKFINGDTLLARITPCLENGKSSYVTFLKDGQVGWGSTEFIIMRSKEKIHSLFTYALARNRDFRDYAEGCLEGSSGRQRVNIDHLVKFEINIPSDDVIQNFNSLMKGIEPKLNNNFYQIRTLEKLRDTLLPKLMSGEVRVAV